MCPEISVMRMWEGAKESEEKYLEHRHGACAELLLPLCPLQSLTILCGYRGSVWGVQEAKEGPPCHLKNPWIPHYCADIHDS